MTAIRDLWRIFKGAGIALDEYEASLLGAPSGDTISVWAAISNRHGNLIAHIACLGLYLVQWQHCRDQIANVPMRPGNYLRAAVLLIVVAPIVFTAGAIRATCNRA